MQAVRAVLQDSGLHPFEQAALANLCPADAEEAAALLPRCVHSPSDLTSACCPAHTVPNFHSLTKELHRTGTDEVSAPDEVDLSELIENIQSFRNFRDV